MPLNPTSNRRGAGLYCLCLFIFNIIPSAQPCPSKASLPMGELNLVYRDNIHHLSELATPCHLVGRSSLRFCNAHKTRWGGASRNTRAFGSTASLNIFSLLYTPRIVQGGERQERHNWGLPISAYFSSSIKCEGEQSTTPSPRI